MKKLLMFSLILLISSKEIQFNTETAYNTESDNSFEFTYNNDNNNYIFVYISCGTVNNVKIEYTDGNFNRGDLSCNKPGEGLLLFPTSERKYTITIKAMDARKDSGTIWVNPSSNEIEVDLSKKYEGKFPIITSKSVLTEPYPKLTYVINNAAKDVTFSFQYTNKEQSTGDETIPNPFKICSEDDCTTAQDTFDFIKDGNYKIEVGMQGMYFDAVLPKFSFADANYKESSGGNGVSNNSFNLRFNLWIISLLLILL